MGKTRIGKHEEVWKLLQAFGIAIDTQKNQQTVGGKAESIEAQSSDVKILVIPTDEELSIAEQTIEVLEEL